MGTLAVTEELHAKQQEAARKEAAARKAPQDAAADAKGAGEPASKKGFGRPEQSSSRSGGPACRPGDGTSMGHRYATPPTCSSGWRC
jgi:membrane protein involved in colicin uptake